MLKIYLWPQDWSNADWCDSFVKFLMYYQKIELVDNIEEAEKIIFFCSGCFNVTKQEEQFRERSKDLLLVESGGQAAGIIIELVMEQTHWLMDKKTTDEVMGPLEMVKKFLEDLNQKGWEALNRPSVQQALSNVDEAMVTIASSHTQNIL